MSRLDLPDGEWAELASPRKVSDRRRRSFIAAMNDSSSATADLPRIVNPRAEQPGQPATVADPERMTGAQAELQFHAMDLLVMCFVKSWSFPEQVTLEAVEDLDTGSKDMLVAKCLTFMEELVPDYGPDIDPKARTSGSSNSHPPSPTAVLTSTTRHSDSTS